jgi:hypothetical protein
VKIGASMNSTKRYYTQIAYGRHNSSQRRLIGIQVVDDGFVSVVGAQLPRAILIGDHERGACARLSAAGRPFHESIRVDAWPERRVARLPPVFLRQVLRSRGLPSSEGRIAKADRLAAIAEVHFQAAPDDDEPPEKAAAMGMPVPPRRTSTDAVSTTRVKRLPSERSNDLDVPTDLQNLPQVKSERRSNFMNKSSYCQR